MRTDSQKKSDYDVTRAPQIGSVFVKKNEKRGATSDHMISRTAIDMLLSSGFFLFLKHHTNQPTTGKRHVRIKFPEEASQAKAYALAQKALGFLPMHKTKHNSLEVKNRLDRPQNR